MTSSALFGGEEEKEDVLFRPQGSLAIARRSSRGYPFVTEARGVADQRSIGARTGRPGATPSTASPLATTDTPFTITCSMPTGGRDGSR